jgi:AraC-like DNA-binding protein
MLYRHWLNLNVHLLWCHDQPVAKGQVVHGPTLRFTQYTNSGAWLVKEGWARVEHDSQIHIAKTGQWLIVKPGNRIQTFASNTRLLSIGFAARWPDGSHLFDEGLSLVFDTVDFPLLERRALPLLKSMKGINPDTWDARDHRVDLERYLELERRLCNWLQALARVLTAHDIGPSGQMEIDERVSKALDLLNACDMGEALDLGRIATHAGISLNHLTRLFRRDLCTTPHEYWDRCRVEYAQGRLSQPDSRAKAVSIELGFKSLSHFSKWFKRHTGISPRNMQKASGLR